MITWHNAETNPPEDGKTVLIAVRGEPEAAEAFLLRAKWIYSSGHDADVAKVYAWAELPACPAIVETLKPLRLRSAPEDSR